MLAISRGSSFLIAPQPATSRKREKGLKSAVAEQVCAVTRLFNYSSLSPPGDSSSTFHFSSLTTLLDHPGCCYPPVMSVVSVTVVGVNCAGILSHCLVSLDTHKAGKSWVSTQKSQRTQQQELWPLREAQYVIRVGSCSQSLLKSIQRKQRHRLWSILTFKRFTGSHNRWISDSALGVTTSTPFAESDWAMIEWIDTYVLNWLWSADDTVTPLLELGDDWINLGSSELVLAGRHY